MWTVLGVGALLLVTAKIPYHFWRPLIPLVLIGAFALMVLVLMPGHRRDGEAGARAWIRSATSPMQPSEVAKLALPPSRADRPRPRPRRPVARSAGALAEPDPRRAGRRCRPADGQPDLGGALVPPPMASIVLAVAFIAGIALTRSAESWVRRRAPLSCSGSSRATGESLFFVPQSVEGRRQQRRPDRPVPRGPGQWPLDRAGARCQP